MVQARAHGVEERMNSRQRQLARLVEVKESLARKYARLAEVAKSETKRKTFLYKFGRYTREAARAKALLS
ncbi:MAG: hypothetical protein GYA33_02650 [Thermogutta sp.]|nr:hypothetical protein [Thermogutta sp.]